MELVSFRLGPSADIRRDLEHLIKRDSIAAAVVLGAVGSLSNVCLRFAGQNRHTTLDDNSYEILTLSGTLGEGGVHLHMSVADESGECKGGHVVYGCRVNTTLEIVIGLLPDVSFLREIDEKTGHKELKVVQQDDSLADLSEEDLSEEDLSEEDLSEETLSHELSDGLPNESPDELIEERLEDTADEPSIQSSDDQADQSPESLADD